MRRPQLWVTLGLFTTKVEEVPSLNFVLAIVTFEGSTVMTDDPTETVIFSLASRWIMGESPDYLGIRLWGLAEGVMFTEQDVRSYAKVAVIGKTVADQLFPDGDAVGGTIRIRNIPFKVLGILESKGFNFFGQDQDDTVIIPYTSHLRRVSRRQYLNSIIVQAATAEQIPHIQQQITDFTASGFKLKDLIYAVYTSDDFVKF